VKKQLVVGLIFLCVACDETKPVPEAVVGEQGFQGERGERGEQGIQGEPGRDGVNGLPGLQGLQGVPGLQGAQGAQGPAGPVSSKRQFFVDTNGAEIQGVVLWNQASRGVMEKDGALWVINLFNGAHEFTSVNNTVYLDANCAGNVYVVWRPENTVSRLVGGRIVRQSELLPQSSVMGACYLQQATETTPVCALAYSNCYQDMAAKGLGLSIPVDVTAPNLGSYSFPAKAVVR
jgi:Collagen triple helix repeat (20 copies)